MRHAACWSLLLLGFVGCRSDATAPMVETGLVLSYRLTDESGRRTSRFAFGDDIHFEYILTNRTGSDIAWTQAYEYPPVGFSVLQKEWRVGSTLLGRGEPGEISGVIPNGTALVHRTSWLSNPSSMVLPPGKYEAWAVFTYDFANHEEPEQEWLEFEVTPRDSREQHVFSLRYLTWYFGIFCLRAGDLYSATILQTRQGTYELFATVLAREDDPQAVCLPEVGSRQCLKQNRLAPIELSIDQSSTFERLLDEFPKMNPEIDFACDPCVSIEYIMNDRLHELSPCTVGPPEYLDHAWELATFVGGVVLGDTQGTTETTLSSRQRDLEGPSQE